VFRVVVERQLLEAFREHLGKDDLVQRHDV
jgi:hypothetical protein